MAREEYKGPNAVAAGWGQSQIDSTVGTLAGGTVGAGVGALMHNSEKAAVAAGERGLWNFFKASSRKGKAVMGALAGALVIGTITQMTGWLRGSKKAEEGRAQFERISTENEQLHNQLNAANQQIEAQKSFAEQIKAEREAPKTPSAAR